VISLLRIVNRALQKLETWLSWLAAGALIAMMGLVNVNVFFRPLGVPIWGTFEIVGFLGAFVISFSLVHPTLNGRHISVELLISRLPESLSKWLAVFNRLVSLCVCGLITWQTALYGLRILESGQVSSTLRMPLYPVLWGISFAFGISAFVLVVDFLNRIFSVEKGK
jgi:TRAP-type transport system small permease protein